MYRLVDRFLRAASLLLLAVYIFLGVYFSVGRFFIPQLSEYAGEIERAVQAATGLHARLAGFEGRWHKLNPRIRIDALHLCETRVACNSGDGVIVLRNGHIRVDVFATLFERELRLTELNFEAVTVTLRNDSGNWIVPGFKSSGGGVAIDLVDLMAHFRHVELGQIQLLMDDGGVVRHSPMVAMQLRRYGQSRRITVHQEEPGESPFALRLEVDGEWRSGEAAVAADIDFHEFDADAWLRMLTSDWQAGIWTGRLRVEQVHKGDWRLASTLERGQLARLDKPWQLAELSGDAAAHIVMDVGMKVWWDHLQGLWNGQVLQVPAALVDIDYQDNEVRGLSLSSPELDVGQVREMVVGAGLVQGRALEILSQLKPTGILRDLEVSAPNGERLHEFAMEARLARVGIEPWRGAPGAEGVSGTAQINVDGGAVQLDVGDSISLFFPTVYRHSLEFDHFSGEVFWRLGERVKIFGEALSLSNPHGQFAGSFLVDLPTRKDALAGPHMSLAVGVQGGDIEPLMSLVPYSLDPGLIEWLERAEIRGAILDGGFLYNGSLTRNDPYGKSIRLFFDVEGAGIKFDPDWERVEGADARVTLVESFTQVQLHKADVSGIQVTDAKVSVAPSTKQRAGAVEVEATLESDFDKALRYLRDSPVDDQLDGLLDSWQGLGGRLVDGNLRLRVPFSGRGGEDLSVDFTGSLQQAALHMRDLDLRFTAIDGPLRYSTKYGLVSKQLDAMLWGKQFDIRMGQFDAGQPLAKPETTSIRAEGIVDMSALASWLEQPFMVFLEGESEAVVGLEINDAGMHLAVESGLVGTSIALPGELAKDRSSSMPTQLEWQMSASTQPMSLRLSSRAAMELYFDNFNLTGATAYVGLDADDFSFSGEQVAWTAGEMAFPLMSVNETIAGSGRIQITGHLNAFDLTDWMPVLDKYNAAEERLARRGEDTEQSPEFGSGATELLLSSLRLDEANTFGLEFSGSVVHATQQGQRWQFFVENDALKGRIVLPAELAGKPIATNDSEERILIDLEYFRIEGKSDLQGEEDPLEFIGDFDIEPLLVQVENFVWGETSMGRWHFKLSGDTSAQQMRAHAINVNIFGVTLTCVVSCLVLGVHL